MQIAYTISVLVGDEELASQLVQPLVGGIDITEQLWMSKVTNHPVMSLSICLSVSPLFVSFI